MGDTYFYEPRLGHGLPHDPFKAIVAPRPIGWISTVDPDGRINLAPYSFFNAFCEFPPIVGFSSGGRKDSQRNVEATGEFVCNLVTRKQALAMNLTSAPFPHGVDEMQRAGLAAATSRLVLEGTIDVTVGEECHRLREGDCLAMRLDRPTLFHNPTRRPARYAVVIASEPPARR